MHYRCLLPGNSGAGEAADIECHSPLDELYPEYCVDIDMVQLSESKSLLPLM